jgi:hypothetical protein
MPCPYIAIAQSRAYHKANNQTDRLMPQQWFANNEQILPTHVKKPSQVWERRIWPIASIRNNDPPH